MTVHTEARSGARDTVTPGIPNPKMSGEHHPEYGDSTPSANPERADYYAQEHTERRQRRNEGKRLQSSNGVSARAAVQIAGSQSHVRCRALVVTRPELVVADLEEVRAPPRDMVAAA